MADITYRDPIVQRIIDMLEANGPTELRGRYVNGDVLKPNQSELPMAYIAKDTVPVEPVDNMENAERHNLVLTVIYDVRQNVEGAYDMVAGVPGLQELCEARDYTTMRLKSDTIMYQLLQQAQLANKLWLNSVGDPVTLNYGMGVGRRGPGTFSVEATIRFVAMFHAPVPGIATND